MPVIPLNGDRWPARICAPSCIISPETIRRAPGASANKTKPLEDHPEFGHTGRPDLPEGVRELIAHPRYIIFYRMLADAGIVEILRVKHAAQQLP
ncbi:type II toxin-antitoxin system RelE/ParE family toxin [Tistrella bauzanensis]